MFNCLQEVVRKFHSHVDDSQLDQVLVVPAQPFLRQEVLAAGQDVLPLLLQAVIDGRV